MYIMFFATVLRFHNRFLLFLTERFPPGVPRPPAGSRPPPAARRRADAFCVVREAVPAMASAADRAVARQNDAELSAGGVVLSEESETVGTLRKK